MEIIVWNEEIKVRQTTEAFLRSGCWDACFWTHRHHDNVPSLHKNAKSPMQMLICMCLLLKAPPLSIWLKCKSLDNRSTRSILGMEARWILLAHRVEKCSPIQETWCTFYLHRKDSRTDIQEVRCRLILPLCVIHASVVSDLADWRCWSYFLAVWLCLN